MPPRAKKATRPSHYYVVVKLHNRTTPHLPLYVHSIIVYGVKDTVAASWWGWFWVMYKSSIYRDNLVCHSRSPRITIEVWEPTKQGSRPKALYNYPFYRSLNPQTELYMGARAPN